MSAAPPRSKRLPRADRERQLLDVAERLFVEKGYDGTSVEDVARAAGVSRPIVYDHHGSKEGLYVACVRRAREAYVERLVAAVSEIDDPLEQLRAGADSLFAVVEEDPERWMVLFGGSAVPLFGELGERLLELRLATIEGIAAIVRRSAPDADPERVVAFAHAISGVGEQLGRWWIRNPSVPRARVVGHYTDFIWAGLRQLADRRD